MHVTYDADPIWRHSALSTFTCLLCVCVCPPGAALHRCPHRGTPRPLLFMYVFPLPAPGHEETGAEAPGTQRPLAELNRPCLKARRQEISLRSQPATLTASDGCIPFPSDAMSLFCLDRFCVAICIYVQRARARSREHIFVYLAHFVSKIEAVTFSTRLLSASVEPKKGRSQIKQFQSKETGGV